MIPTERHKEVFRHLEDAIAHESPEIAEFYTTLTKTDEPLSVELLSDLAPYWREFRPVVANDEVHAYAKEPVTPLTEPLLLFTNAPSAGGKTAVTLGLVREFSASTNLIRTCTTREIRPEEQQVIKNIQISTDPDVTAGVSTQYIHVTKDQFLALNQKEYFLETRSQWETRHSKGDLYGIPREYLLNGINKGTPFTYLIVNEDGQVVVENKLKEMGNPIKTQRWFVLPTEQTFRDLRDRIIFQRAGEQVENTVARVVGAVYNLYAGEHADVVIPNPYEASGKPTRAIEHAHILMYALRPDVVPAPHK
jgi:guanylate kinase